MLKWKTEKKPIYIYVFKTNFTIFKQPDTEQASTEENDRGKNCSETCSTDGKAAA